MKQQDIEDYEVVREIEDGITLVKTKDIFIPYNLKVEIKEAEGMAELPPSPYFFPSNQKGKESISTARAIKTAILRKVYPDTWALMVVEPRDKFALNAPIDAAHAGYHYVRYKSPCLTRPFPVFEVKVYNPENGRLLTIAQFPFSIPYSGQSLETAYYQACVEVDRYYGLPEKSFSEYLTLLKLTKGELAEIQKINDPDKNDSKKREQNNRRTEYLQKYTPFHQSAKPKKTRDNLFAKKSIEEFKSLPCGYPYIYYNHVANKLSANVPAYEEHDKATLGTFEIDKDNFKEVWINLAMLVDAHFNRSIGNKTYYEKLLPTLKKIKSKD